MEKIACSVEEAAEMLGLSPCTVYTLSHRADFPAFKAGSRTIVSVQGLKEWALRQAAAEKEHATA